MKNIYASLICCNPFLILLSFVFIPVLLSAQSTAIVKGKTLDSLSSAPLSFSGVAVFKSADKKLEKESVANEAGDFTVQLGYGRYYAQIDFMGYKPYRTAEFTVSKDN